MSDYQAMMNGLSELLDLPNVKVTGMQQQGHSIIRLRVISTSEAGVCPDCGTECVNDYATTFRMNLRLLFESAHPPWIQNKSPL